MNGKAGSFQVDPASALFTNTGENKLASSISPVASYASTSVGGGIVVGRSAGTAAFSFSTDQIEAGTFIKFSNHDKVYMTTQPLEYSGSLGESVDTGPFFQRATISLDNRRDTNSPKLDGDLLVTLSAIDPSGSVDDNALTVVTVATLANDSASQIAVKIAAAVNASGVLNLGFAATASGSSVEIRVTDSLGGTSGGRKVYVQSLIQTISNGITGIRTDVDNFTVIGGGSPATLYFDPPLREAIDTTTTISIAPLDSVPFRVAMTDDKWNVKIDESQHYNAFTLTFQEIF
tara:strand:- start:5245 stop:6114 length:870 start_codon:yes stop_codon:yes gene_type:complete